MSILSGFANNIKPNYEEIFKKGAFGGNNYLTPEDVNLAKQAATNAGRPVEEPIQQAITNGYQVEGLDNYMGESVKAGVKDMDAKGNAISNLVQGVLQNKMPGQILEENPELGSLPENLFLSMGPDIMNAVKMAEENNIAPTEELGRMFNLYKENSPEFRQFLEIDKKEGSGGSLKQRLRSGQPLKQEFDMLRDKIQNINIPIIGSTVRGALGMGVGLLESISDVNAAWQMAGDKIGVDYVNYQSQMSGDDFKLDTFVGADDPTGTAVRGVSGALTLGATGAGLASGGLTAGLTLAIPALLGASLETRGDGVMADLKRAPGEALVGGVGMLGDVLLEVPKIKEVYNQLQTFEDKEIMRMELGGLVLGAMFTKGKLNLAKGGAQSVKSAVTGNFGEAASISKDAIKNFVTQNYPIQYMQNIADDITLKNAWRLTKEIRAKGVDDSLKNSVSRVNKGIYDTYEAVAKDFAENKSAQSLGATFMGDVSSLADEYIIQPMKQVGEQLGAMRKAIANSDGTPLTVDIDRVFRRLDDLLDNDSRQPFRVNRNGNLVLKNEAITPDMGNPQVAFIADVYNLLREIKQGGSKAEDVIANLETNLRDSFKARNPNASMTQVNRYITSLSEEVHKMVGDKLGKPYMEAMKEYSKYAKAKNIADNYLTRDQNGLEVFDVNRIRAIAQDSTAGEMGRQFYQMMDEFAGTNIGRNLLDEAIAVGALSKMYTPKASPFSLDYVPVTPINQVMLLANSIWRHVANPKGILRQMTDDSSLPEARKPQVQNYLKQMADNLGKEVLGGNSDYKGIYSLYNDEVSLALSLENRIQAAKITNNTMLSRTDIEDIIRRKPIQQLEPTDTRRTPVELVKTAAQDYNNSKRLPKIVDGIATKVRVSKTQARAIAAAYDKLKVDNSKDPKVKKAYEALGKEIQEQWDYATNEMGIEFIPRVGEGQPYANSAEMINDIRKNGRLFFFTGGEPHPLLGAIDPDTGLSLNDKFRAVHDLFGHGSEGANFGPVGEETTWLKHSQMFSKEAQKALTTETRGQNSRVNYGEQNYAKAGKYKNLPMSQRPYAIQKVDLLPDEFTNYDSKLKMINGYQDVDLNFKDQGAFAKFRQENADYMIVSAENVMGKMMDSKQNSKNMKAFEGFLKKNNIDFVFQKGVWMNDEGKILPEKSSLIRIKNAEERKLVNDYIQSKYPQESGIIVKDGYAVYYDNKSKKYTMVNLMDYEGNLQKHANTKYNYSEIDGKKYRFPFEEGTEISKIEFDRLFNN